MRLTVPPELVEAARSGNGESMERLLRTLWPHAYRIARSIVQHTALAEDAAQEACAIVYRDIGSLRTIAAFPVWCYRIVAREAVRAAKHNVTRSTGEQCDVHVDIDTKLDVLRALSRLTPNLRSVVVLHYYADLNSTEIGHVLRIPAATVRFRLAAARRRLSQLLNPELVAAAGPEVCHEL